MTEPVKLLLIYVNESDRWQDTPLYEAIVDRLRHLHVAGVSATTRESTTSGCSGSRMIGQS
jgi:PII-like signaling protein